MEEQAKHLVGSQNQWAVVKTLRGDKEIFLRPIGHKILVLEDEFKSRFDCEACNGKGHTEELCPLCKGTTLEKQYDENLNENVMRACRACTVGEAGMRISHGHKLCAVCNGRKGTIIIAEESQRHPTTGKVIAIGSYVSEYKVGDNVLFNNYTGSGFDMEGLRLRVIVEHDILCQTKGLNQSLSEKENSDLKEAGVV